LGSDARFARVQLGRENQPDIIRNFVPARNMSDFLMD
jgi:hypothetical protein